MMPVAQTAADKIRAGLDKASIFGEPPDKTIYRRIAQEFHPDRNPSPEAAKIMAAATEVWDGRPNPFDTGPMYRMSAIDGTSWIIRPKDVLAIPSGVRLSGSKSVTYDFNKACAAQATTLYGTLKDAAKGLSVPYWQFGSEAVREQCLTGPDAFLPHVRETMQGQGGARFIRLRIRPTLVPLDLVLKYSGGKLDGRHVAWILSGLYNAACYMEHSSLVHLGITPESIYIEPETHRIMLMGWEHACRLGDKAPPIPAAVKQALPSSFAGKKASLSMTLSLIRWLGRSMLGDPCGSRMIREPKSALTTFLLDEICYGDCPGTAINHYKDWRNATASTYGGHIFHKMDAALVANPAIVYEEKHHG